MTCQRKNGLLCPPIRPASRDGNGSTWLIIACALLDVALRRVLSASTTDRVKSLRHPAWELKQRLCLEPWKTLSGLVINQIDVKGNAQSLNYRNDLAKYPLYNIIIPDYQCPATGSNAKKVE